MTSENVTDKIISFTKRLGIEVMYMYDDQEEVYLKSLPHGELFAKLRGGKEFEISFNNYIVFRAVCAQREISKEEFDIA